MNHGRATTRGVSAPLASIWLDGPRRWVGFIGIGTDPSQFDAARYRESLGREQFLVSARESP